jgi:hypothetical protein
MEYNLKPLRAWISTLMHGSRTQALLLFLRIPNPWFTLSWGDKGSVYDGNKLQRHQSPLHSKMTSYHADQALAQIRRDKIRKLSLFLIFGVFSALVLVFVSLQYHRGVFALGSTTSDGTSFSPSSEQSVCISDHNMTAMFGADVKSASILPTSEPGGTRFAYASYATSKEYLCNTVSPP